MTNAIAPIQAGLIRLRTTRAGRLETFAAFADEQADLEDPQ